MMRPAETPEKLTLAFLTQRLEPALKKSGFHLRDDGWFALSRPDGVDFRLTTMKLGEGALTRCDFLVDVIDQRQIDLLEEWLCPVSDSLVERASRTRAQREGRKGYEVGWEQGPDIVKWFGAPRARPVKFTPTMYCFYTPPALLVPDRPPDYQALLKALSRYAMQYNGWRLRALDDGEDSAKPFNAALAGMVRFAREILLPLGSTISLRELLDESNAIRRALIGREAPRQHVSGRSHSRWLMALDLSAAIVTDQFELVNALLKSRRINSGDHRSDLDEEAYQRIVECAVSAARRRLAAI